MVDAWNISLNFTSCCGDSFCSDDVILNLVRLFENSRLNETTEASSIFLKKETR